jgi:predicted RNase H-like HicB family nuclease
MKTVMRYAIVIEHSGNNYSAYVPDLTGCVATGSTARQVRTRIRQAMVMHLEGLREDGVPFPPSRTPGDYVEVAA